MTYPKTNHTSLTSKPRTRFPEFDAVARGAWAGQVSSQLTSDHDISASDATRHAWMLAAALARLVRIGDSEGIEAVHRVAVRKVAEAKAMSSAQDAAQQTTNDAALANYRSRQRRASKAARALACAVCEAAPGHPCITSTGKQTEHHQARTRAGWEAVR